MEQEEIQKAFWKQSEALLWLCSSGSIEMRTPLVVWWDLRLGNSRLREKQEPKIL